MRPFFLFLTQVVKMETMKTKMKPNSIQLRIDKKCIDRIWTNG